MTTLQQSPPRMAPRALIRTFWAVHRASTGSAAGGWDHGVPGPGSDSA